MTTPRPLPIIAPAVVAAALWGAPAEAAFPGTNGRIAFESARDGNEEIYSVNPDGSDGGRLTQNTASDIRPAWSADGREIAFASGRDGNSDVYVMKADGSGQLHLTDDPGFDGWPDWSPGGDRLAFESTRDGDWEIFVMSRDGSGQTRRTENGAFDGHPAWSPDGQKIAFSSTRDGGLDVYAMHADGTAQTRLTTGAADDSHPSWSPDGQKIAFVSTRDGNPNVYVMNADGTGQVRLTDDVGSDRHPEWSPDGKQIAFDSDRDGNANVYVMNADGSHQIQLTDNPASDSNPSWQPLGAQPAPPPPDRREPPSTPAPRVTAVQSVAAPKPGSATVLSAAVTGSATRLEWNLRGDSRPEAVSYAGQPSLRFRPPPGRPFTVSVRALGPGGVGPALSQTFNAPAPIAGGLAGRITAKIAKQPPVVAVGSLPTLAKLNPVLDVLASQGCAVPTVIRAGQLEVEGCFAPIGKLAEIPAAERGVVERLAKRLGLPGDPGTRTLETAIRLTDAYVARGRVTVNGVTLDTGSAAEADRSSVVVYPQANAIATSKARISIGDLRLATRSDFVIDTRAAGGEIRLGSFARSGGISSLGGFSLAGDVDVTLLPPNGATPAEARITARLALPSFLKVGGVDFQSSVNLRATAAEGLIVDDMTIGPLNADIGALAVKDLRLSYTRKPEGDEWLGQGKACVISGACLNMIPDKGHVRIKNGKLDYAGASLDFPGTGIPLFTGVFLERIGFGLGLDPTRMVANARLGFAEIVVLDGNLLMAFPSAGTPFVFRREEVGNNFPAHFYDRRHTGTTIGASASASLRLRGVAEVPLAGAYVLYEYPGYIALGGGIDFNFMRFISIDGRVDGEFNAANGRFNVYGGVEACVVAVICQGVKADVSNLGMSVCTAVDTGIHEFHMGGAIRWSPVLFTPYLDGCAWGRYREPNVRGARAAQAGQPYVVRMGRDARSRMVMLDGEREAPRVRVTGPGGQVLTSPAGTDLVTTQNAAIRILRSEEHKFVAVGIADARPGAYRIEPMDGSPPVAQVREATALLAARVTARVRRRGRGRALDYVVRRRPGQRVTFIEVDGDGAARTIGTVDGGGSGTLPFAPAPGSAKRRVEARFELNGVPEERQVVARFSPPAVKLGRPARPRVQRRGASLRVSWRRVSGAARYEVVVTGSGGERRLRSTRGQRMVLKRVAKSSAGRVSIRAVDRLRTGPPARVRFRRVAPRKTRLAVLPRCRGKTRLVCVAPRAPRR